MSDGQKTRRVLFTWGSNSYGQLGLGGREDTQRPQQVPELGEEGPLIKSISAGGGHSAVITDSGNLYVCGQNKSGQLGLGHFDDLPRLTLCTALLHIRVTKVSCGWDFSIILTVYNSERKCTDRLPYDNGQLYSCGSNAYGQLGNSQQRASSDPKLIQFLFSLTGSIIRGTMIQGQNSPTNKIAVQLLGMASRWQQAFYKTDSSWDRITDGGRPYRPCLWNPSPVQRNVTEKIVDVAAGLRHSLAVTESGQSLHWGSGLASHARRFCQGEPILAFYTAQQPCPVPGLENVKTKQVAAGSYHSVVLSAAGELHVWGSNKYGQLLHCEPFIVQPRKISCPMFSGEAFRAVWSGWSHVIAQSETGQVFTWGRSDYGQLGAGMSDVCANSQESQGKSLSKGELKPPFCVSVLSGASQIACGSEHNLALCGNTVYSWGWNEHGMCGNGGEDNVSAPTAVILPMSCRVELIGCGAGHSMVLCTE